MASVSPVEVLSIIASVASVILAVGAIWLSIVFYKMSTAASSATTEAAKGIAASVERLEKLFDKLYSDTFSMMRDTVSDMRKHIWPAEEPDADKAVEEAEKKADEKIGDLKKAMEQQVAEVLQRQKVADDRVSAVRTEMRRLLDRAIVTSRQVETEAREETIREHLLRTLRVLSQERPRVTVDDVLQRLRRMFPMSRIVREIDRMRDERLVVLGSPTIGPDTEIRLPGSESLEPVKDQ